MPSIPSFMLCSILYHCLLGNWELFLKEDTLLHQIEGQRKLQTTKPPEEIYFKTSILKYNGPSDSGIWDTSLPHQKLSWKSNGWTTEFYMENLLLS